MIHESIVADARSAPSDAAPPGFAALSRREIVLLLTLCWAFACGILVLVNWHDIATLAYPDPDDKLRLVEVRDFLSGQSWWDIGQHRINPPAGGTMHWSRIVDLPIAFFILLFKPFLGYAQAQVAAAIAVPLVTLGFTMAMVALLTRRLIGREAAFLAALLVTVDPGALQQMRPLRVDHHGWQIGLAVAVAIALIDGNRKRSGLIGGAVLAFWLRISLEGLPLAAATGAFIGLRWALAGNHDEDRRLVHFFGALAIGSALLFVAFIPYSQWRVAWCDSFSFQHLAMCAVAFVGSLAMIRVPPRALPRLAAGAGVAALSLAAFHFGAPRCGLDAFADMEPLVRKFWYSSVPEGLPLWKQSPMIVALGAGYPIVGLIGGVLAWRASEGTARERWSAYLFMLGATLVATILVQRIGATANTIALAGGAWLLLSALHRIRKLPRATSRILLTTGAIFSLAPVTPALIVVEAAPANAAANNTAHVERDCTDSHYFRALDALPTARMLAPVDIGPSILLDSPHSVVATGHHRNHTAMADVIRTFLGDDATAHAIVARRGIAFVTICRGTAELQVYGHYAPKGFANALSTDRPPAWLAPVPLTGGGPLRVWRVIG